jgi:hypothetical protein
VQPPRPEVEKAGDEGPAVDEFGIPLDEDEIDVGAPEGTGDTPEE